MQAAVAILADVLGMLFSVGMVYFGGAVSFQAWEFGDVSTTVLRVPLWIYFAALPAGGFVMAVAYIVRLKRKLTAKEGTHA
jgi:TRAP-type C4-dicarboxylate transport system permease small subunit